MIDKSLVKRRFKKSLTTYDDNAIVQKEMAAKLIELLPEKEFSSVFEIGCSTGILTKQISENVKFDQIWVNDIVAESKKYIDNILLDYTFISGDIETISIDKKFDLIVSNACLQWCNDINKVIDKLYGCLNKCGVLAVSIFGDMNLKEIKNIFDIKEKTYVMSELQECLKIYKTYNVIEETVELEFDCLKDILQHIKYTGANSLKECTLTKTVLKNNEEQYRENFSKNNILILTYNPVYIIIKK
ncbi:malonyl-ACP O-methyltransferase BioC [bacterium]|nr:malonyl-ACP O-methyltransferase BioC [bacterium]